MSKDVINHRVGQQSIDADTTAKMDRRNLLLGSTTYAAASALGSAAATTQITKAQAQAPSGQRPNILFIMGDDIGWFNIGA
jgi:arylsulfatase